MLPRVLKTTCFVLQVLQDCFESKSIEKLEEAIASMPHEEATYHMKRCVDSGLWVPDAKKAAGDQPKEEEPEAKPE